jgi:hypothetical protein
MVKKFNSEKDKPAVKKELSKNVPMVVRFHKDSCPACMMSEAPWNEFTRSPPRGVVVISVEEKAIPPEMLENISGFPTYAVNGNGKSTHHTGAIMNAGEIRELIQPS